MTNEADTLWKRVSIVRRNDDYHSLKLCGIRLTFGVQRWYRPDDHKEIFPVRIHHAQYQFDSVHTGNAHITGMRFRQDLPVVHIVN